jgi:hypothetical protein
MSENNRNTPAFSFIVIPGIDTFNKGFRHRKIAKGIRLVAIVIEW